MKYLVYLNNQTTLLYKKMQDKHFAFHGMHSIRKQKIKQNNIVDP